MADKSQAFLTGVQQGQSQAVNPFGVILNGIAEEQKRRQAKEEELKQALSILAKKQDLEKEMVTFKGAEDRKTEREKGLAGWIPVSNSQESNLPAQGILQQTGLGQSSNISTDSNLPSKTEYIKDPTTGQIYSKQKSQIDYNRELEAIKLERELGQGKQISEATLKESILPMNELMGGLSGNIGLVTSDEKYKNYFGIGQPALSRLMTKLPGEKNADIQALIGSTERMAQTYRSAVTKSQASMKELIYLRNIFPTMNNTYDAFLKNSYLTALTAKNAMERQRPVFEAAGYSTKAIQESLNQMDKQLSEMGNKIGKDKVSKYNKEFEKKDFGKPGEYVTVNSEDEVMKLDGKVSKGTKIRLYDDKGSYREWTQN